MEKPRKFPLLLRMVVLLLSMVSGVYIFSICMEPMTYFRSSDLLRTRMVLNSCPNTKIHSSEIPYIHFPSPRNYSRQECACNPVRLFAIISMQRSGSGWFETLLNSHENVSSNGEIFGARDRRVNISAIYNILDQVYNLDWYSSSSKNECSAAVGFKWMLNQGLTEYHEGIAKYFRKRGVHAIYLFRRNHLRRMISLLANAYDKETKPLNGTHKSHVYSPREAHVLARYKPSLNATRLVRELMKAEQKTARALEYFKSSRSIVVYYEDIVRNRTKLIEVLDFLKLPHRKLRSNQVKIHTGSLLTQIENAADVERALKGTTYERYLHSDYQ
ncbi:OLC1v1017753C2 [Oldenlandia corymbosa var. corymbosa]|nr:OLC1v1017753C2 [Oldenlandia corymbosa var. corymbosa]